MSYRVCAAEGEPWRRRQGVPCAPALGVPQQALRPGVRGLRRDPDARDAHEAFRSNPRRDRIADVRIVFADVKAPCARLSLDNVAWVEADEVNRR